jgi:hypothetical protein
VRGAATFRSPFSDDLRRASVAAGELEVEDRWPARDVRRVDHFEDYRERDGGDPGQDQGTLAMRRAHKQTGSVAQPRRSQLIVRAGQGPPSQGSLDHRPHGR